MLPARSRGVARAWLSGGDPAGMEAAERRDNVNKGSSKIFADT
jgi:hypothetical protein